MQQEICNQEESGLFRPGFEETLQYWKTLWFWMGLDGTGTDR